MRADVFAGITVAIVLIPQALAYALFLGLPPVHGLYAAFFGVVGGALWGSSRHMITGPVGVMSLLTLAALVPFAGSDPSRIIAATVLLAVFVGITHLILGVFRLGFLIRLVPHSVLTGFTVGAAIVIGTTQVPLLFGFSIERHEFFFGNILEIARSLSETHLLTLLIGAASVAGLLVLKRMGNSFPAALGVMGAATATSFIFGLADKGVAVIGTVPQSWPTLSHIRLNDFLAIGTDTLSLALIGFLSAIAIARSLALRTREHVDVNQELIGQGVANVASGLFGGFPVSGSFSLSALNYESGARTILSSLAAGACIVIAIFALTPFLYFLPHATLAAVIIVSVASLARFRDIAHLYELSYTDGLIATLTCAAAFILQPQDAVLIGVVVALLLLLRTVMMAEVPEVGYHPEWHTLQQRDKHPEVLFFPRALIVRIDYSFVFANAERIVEEIYNRLHEREQRDGERVRVLVCNFSGVNTMDGSGVEALRELQQELSHTHVQLAVAYLKHPVHVVLERAGLLPQLSHLHNIDEIRAYCSRFAKIESISPIQ
jgi:SulP family sulfate permease